MLMILCTSWVLREIEREIDDANCTKERRFTLGHGLRLGFRVYGNP